MTDKVRVELLPVGRTLHLDRGTPLQDVLFAQGVEFPCGGHGRCRGCRVRILDGVTSATLDEARLLPPDELAAGWRLACRTRADRDLKIDLAQWEAAILADDSGHPFLPRDGLGVAVDVGTTTLVAQLLDLRTGQVLAVRSALNAQARHGADVMSRIGFALESGGEAELTRLIREQLGAMIADLLSQMERRSLERLPPHDPGHPLTRSFPAGGTTLSPVGEREGVREWPVPLFPVRDPLSTKSLQVRDIVLVGNTAMHHLFSGISVAPLAAHPFAPEADGLQVFESPALGWPLPGDPTVRFLPCLGGFVGSDILAGLLATRLHEADAPSALVDLGTNGEIVVGNRERLLCASTAAGPAFEGARISMGMRAVTGAITEVTLSAGRLGCRVLGNVPPRGLCGSGLVDAVAAGLNLNLIDTAGRLRGGGDFQLQETVALKQADVRELQLAKAAISAGLRLLAQAWGTAPEKLGSLHLAGAFGNYVNRDSARRIGLLNLPAEKVIPAGNTALLGAKLALCHLPVEPGDYATLRARVRHVPLHEDPRFLDAYVEEMAFPTAEAE